ncbi:MULTISPECIES: Hpt domain-containing protein [Hyphobacterium]|uniref:Hpt domain-containing protein n=1 Tax=Hyphobacterium vulgare TaxID=1736751 RepID=A0ABV7A031_9PROT
METLIHNGPAPVFDRDHLAQYTSGDAALEAELFGLLKDQAERCLGALQAANDANAWRAAAHTLKGASRGVGAFELAEACERAEDATEASWPAAVANVRAAANRAFAEMKRVLG